MKYILNNSFLAKKMSNGNYLIGSTLDNQYEIDLDDSSKKIFEIFSSANTIEYATKTMEGIIDKKEVEEIIKFGIEQKFIVQDFEDKIIDKKTYNPIYDRQIRLFEEISPGLGFKAQENLANSRITLLGIGGTGSYTLYTLAAMGVGFVRAVDFDEVQPSNLSRQILYNRADIGKMKIDCAKERIYQLNPDLEYEYVNKKIETVEDIEEW